MFQATPLLGYKASAVNMFDTIFVKIKDMGEGQRKYENLREILTHEAIHTLQAMKYGGLIKQKIVTPYWVQEGYPTYIVSSQVNSKNFKKFIIYYKKHGLEGMRSYEKYVFYAFLVKHAIEKMHKSVDDMHLGKVDYDEVLDSLLREYNVTGR